MPREMPVAGSRGLAPVAQAARIDREPLSLSE
jgi:hypothetical protein